MNLGEALLEAGTHIGVFAVAGYYIQAYLKAGLDRAAEEHRVRFSALHARRARIISDVYSKLVESELGLERAADIQLGDDDRRRLMRGWGTHANEFFDYYARNRIWLAPEACALIDRLWSALKEAGYSATDATSPYRTNSTLDWYGIMREKAHPVKADLEREFRRLLGVVEVSG